MNEERTLLIIKPDAVKAGNAANIVMHLLDKGFAILHKKDIVFSKQDAEKFYAVHTGKPFFANLVSFMSSGPAIALMLEGDNAIEHLREVIGNTHSGKAASGTIRFLYGNHEVITENAVHASDSEESSFNELEAIFWDGLGSIQEL